MRRFHIVPLTVTQLTHSVAALSVLVCWDIYCNSKLIFKAQSLPTVRVVRYRATQDGHAVKQDAFCHSRPSSDEARDSLS